MGSETLGDRGSGRRRRPPRRGQRARGPAQASRPEAGRLDLRPGRGGDGRSEEGERGQTPVSPVEPGPSSAASAGARHPGPRGDDPGDEAAGRESETEAKLGAWRQYQDQVKLLERIDKTVITDKVELRRTRGGVYEVDVTFNGKVTRPMIFDTGAALTLIPARLAAEIGLNVSPSDPDIRCETADGTVVVAKQKTIP